MATERDVPAPPSRDTTDATGAANGVGLVVPRASRRQRRDQPFFPAVFFGASLYILATAIALVTLAIISPAPLQNPADPLNHEKVDPRPEWYFLFLFQILKVFQGPWELVGTAVIPAILALLLLGLPFYDRNWSRRAVRRPAAISLSSLMIVGLLYLTYRPIADTAALRATSSDLLTTVSPRPTWANIHAIFAQNCRPCHVGGGNSGGLNLDTYENALKGGSKAAGGVIEGSVIKPGNAQDSYLWQVVAWRKDLYKVGQNMPLGGPQLSKTDQQNIYNWIQNGAKKD
jgi:menaquinol-cytochrome c reductase cytochrome b/c subunit